MPRVTQKIGDKAEPGTLNEKTSQSFPTVSGICLTTPSPRSHLLFNKYLLSPYYVPDNVPNLGDTAVSKTNKLLPSWGFHASFITLPTCSGGTGAVCQTWETWAAETSLSTSPLCKTEGLSPGGKGA